MVEDFLDRQSDTKGRMVYIKNICFSYENK